MTDVKRNFKDSLNLPRTDFPMRANLNQNEPQTLKRWQKEGMYAKVTDARTDAPLYRFHDGPPYANGSIHLGPLMNKVLNGMEMVGLAPKGSGKVREMLRRGQEGLTEGGKMGTFTPMYLVHAQKPGASVTDL